MRITNNAEAGTNGVTVTQGVGGNTGGSSGDYFDSVSIGAGGALTFDNTNARDILSYKVAPASNQVDYFEWSTQMGTVTTVYGRLYRLSTGTIGAGIFARYRSGATVCCSMRNGGTLNTFDWLDSAGNVIAPVSGISYSSDVWYRIEYKIVFSTTVGSIDWFLYQGDSTTADGSWSATNQNLGASSADSLRLGRIIGVPNTQVIFLDNIEVNNTGFPGVAPTVNTYATPGTTALVLPVGVSLVTVETTGGGGGGAAGTAFSTNGGGAGGGGYASVTNATVPSGGTLQVVVGAVGTKGSGSGSNGVAGGESKVTTLNGAGTKICGANGGGAGLTGGGAGAGGTVTAGSGSTGGAGAAAGGTNGGGAGGGAGSTGTGNAASGQTGGAAKLSDGGKGGDGGSSLTPSAGQAGSNYGGGGGGGGTSGGTVMDGGNGAGGKVVVTYTPVTIIPHTFGANVGILLPATGSVSFGTGE